MGQDLTKLTPDELKARQIKEMDAEMKQKLQRVKVVIKGDKNTGKTCLWRRLQRMSFLEDYRSTEQIQIATIAWDYKATSDKIKVEVWDVVDKASKRKESGNLKIGIQGEDGLDVDLSDDDDEERKTPNLPATTPGVNPQGSFAVDKLDAETVNVYKNCHAVLFLMDPRKKWTFDYIERELPNVPKSTFVLILVNYKDVPQNQRVISEYEMQEFARNAGKFVRCLECSMRNCYGMKGIRCFFNLPFLKLKRQYIIQQLKENEADLDAADQELDLVNSEQNYDFYLKWLEENRKNVKATAQMTSVLPDGPPPRAAIGSSKGTEVTAASLTDDPKMNRSRSASVPQNPGAGGPARQPTPAKQLPAPVANTAVRGGVGPGGFGSYSHALPKSTNSQPSTTQTPAASARPTQPPQPTTPQRAPAAAAVPPAQAEAAKTAPAEGGGLMSWTSKLFSSSAASPAKPAAAAPKREVRDVVADLQKLAKDPAARSAQTPSSVEDFVPPTEGGGDDFWGGDDDDDDDDEQKANANGDSDDDDGRSLIAKDEDLEDDDEEEEEVSPAAAKAKAKREREEREKREREREQKERELKEKERQRKERERERAQAEALRRQFEQQEAAAAAAAAAAKPGGDYKQVSDDDDDDDDVTADVDSTPSAAPNGHKPAEKPKKKEKSIWGTKEEDSDDDDDDDDDNEAWGLPPKNKKDGAAAKKKTKSNPFIVTNDEDLPSDDDDDEKPAKPSITSASMGVLPSATTSVSEKERRREEKERERESRRKRRGVNGSYGDLADASKGESSSTPEGERKERKSRHRHRGERGDEATPEGERRERKSRHRHRGEGGETTSGSGERESRRSSRSSKRSHHRSRSASPTPPS